MIVVVVPSDWSTNLSYLDLVGAVRVGSDISSIATDVTGVPGQGCIPTCLANLLFVVMNSDASLVDPKENSTFCNPAVGAE